MQKTAIFPLFYLPPINYFTLLKAHDYNVILEKFEHFPKQTYRNRATIASPNGGLDLTVPVAKGSKIHTPFKDVKISYDVKWQRLQWLSLQACYRSSAYFEFYEDSLAPFYEKQYTFLFDYNQELLNWVLKQLKTDHNFTFTDTYQQDIDAADDYRMTFTKKNVPLIEVKPYFQVFSDRNEFISNLSIVDLLFNKGPQAKSYL
ncbi:WbqC family protein [Pedobacter montanisoli]|uniref:WbqC family protein n=1 Tax=Pedobacter montanisoli TaxID=2923277 RepID=A0ABS9ZY54_9SPHI|nr:WbqC family protein [Pedobacter montanisoli]MCJ0743252.1 WbqC family protein [Pedobacter montanisoli]